MIARSHRFGAVLTAASLFVLAACSSGATPSPPSAASAATTPVDRSGRRRRPGGPAAAGSAAAVCETGSITAAGSTALQPLVDAAGKAYVAAVPRRPRSPSRAAAPAPA